MAELNTKLGLKAMAGAAAFGGDREMSAAFGLLAAGLGKNLFSKLFPSKLIKLDRKFDKVLSERKSLLDTKPELVKSSLGVKLKGIAKTSKDGLSKLLMKMLAAIKAIFGIIFAAVKAIAKMIFTLAKKLLSKLFSGLLQSMMRLCRRGALRKLRVRLKLLGRKIKKIPKGPAAIIIAAAAFGLFKLISSLFKKEHSELDETFTGGSGIFGGAGASGNWDEEKPPAEQQAPGAPQQAPEASAEQPGAPQQAPEASAEQPGAPQQAPAASKSGAPQQAPIRNQTASTNVESPLAANIAKYESGGAGYNAYNKGTIGNRMIGSDKPIDFSKMSIEEYFKRAQLPADHPDKLFAVGKYQIIPITMQDAVKSMQLNPKTTYLDPSTQEAIFSQFLIGAKRPNVRAYLSGKSDDVNRAVLDLAQEFASIGVPYDMKGHSGQNLRKGQSYYTGSGGNVAHNNPDNVAEALTQQRHLNISKATGSSTRMASTQTETGQSLASAGQTQRDKDSNKKTSIIVADSIKIQTNATVVKS